MKLLAILAAAGILAGIGYLARYELRSRRFDTLHNSGIDSWAINLMLHSPAAETALGKPIHEIGLPKGEAMLPKEGGYAQAVLRVAGPKGAAKLCIVGNRNEDGWDVEGAELILAGGRGTIDVTPPVSDEDVQLPGFGKVYLIPLDRSVAKLLAGLPAYYRAKLGIDVTVLAPVMPGSGVVDSAKQEVIAEKLMEFMQQSYPQVAADPSARLIGVTDKDMEDQSLGWDHTLNFRVRRIGVISILPLEPKGASELANPLVLPVRLRKIITKNIGLLDFPLTLSSDPTSVLAGNNGQPSAVDLMGENFRDASGEWAPGWIDDDATVDITRQADGSTSWRLGVAESPPIDTESELWQNDMSVGLFVERQMDFYYDEPFPVRFARVYRPHDNWPRAFGIGTTDSFDPLLVGVFGSWCDLVLADGMRIHYSRDRLKLVSQVYEDGTGWMYPYGGTVLRYNGRVWTLKRTDGWTMVFPNGYSSHRPQQAAMIGLYDDHGHKFGLDRDSEGDLLHLLTPEGNRIDFRYDSDGRVIHAADNHGRTVDYTYDAKGRLVYVKDSTGRAERYAYDGKNEMTRIEDGAGHVLMTNEYDEAGWVVRQQLADGRTFRYRYQRDARGNVQRAEFIDPQGYQIDYSFARGGYWQSWPRRLARAKP